MILDSDFPSWSASSAWIVAIRKLQLFRLGSLQLSKPLIDLDGDPFSRSQVSLDNSR
jgi:hypothetical protein